VKKDFGASPGEKGEGEKYEITFKVKKIAQEKKEKRQKDPRPIRGRGEKKNTLTVKTPHGRVVPQLGGEKRDLNVK